MMQKHSFYLGSSLLAILILAWFYVRTGPPNSRLRYYLKWHERPLGSRRSVTISETSTNIYELISKDNLRLQITAHTGFNSSTGRVPISRAEFDRSVTTVGSNRPNIENSTSMKIIYGATEFFQKQNWSLLLDLENCEYKNCITKTADDYKGIKHADVVMFIAKLMHGKSLPILPWNIRKHQFWVVMTQESSGYSFNHFPVAYNLQFNATMLWRRDSTIYYPFGKAVHKITNLPYYMLDKEFQDNRSHTNTIDFAQNKTKHAFAYLTNCESKHYNRYALMVELSRYIKVDIYSRKCRGNLIKQSPCPRLLTGANSPCEETFNRHHRFFFAFENSLCKDYIDKLFDRLKSQAYFLPVVMGGLSIEDYSRIAPPNSFLHVNNFTNVRQLGEYLKYLTENDEAYNRYHQWRYDYYITTSRAFGSCELCKMANEMPSMPAIQDIASWFNDPKRCRTYSPH